MEGRRRSERPGNGQQKAPRGAEALYAAGKDADPGTERLARLFRLLASVDMSAQETEEEHEPRRN